MRSSGLSIDVPPGATHALGAIRIDVVTLELALLVEVVGGILERGLDRATAQALADELAGLLVRRKLLEVGKLAQRAQAELLEKRLGRAVQDCLALVGSTTDLAHETLVD